MKVTPATVQREYERVRDRADRIVPIVNDVRATLGVLFDADVDPITPDQYRTAIDAAFADGDRAVNAAALVALLSELDVENDYPGFVVDELLGRELAGLIAGQQPLRLLAEATFHVADVQTHGEGDDAAGVDDLDAAIAAGVQTRLPGWEWTDGESPFAVE